jgi:hypothetical protein
MTTKHHEIEITVNGKGVFLARPAPELAIGDTVRYVCKSEGTLTIAFPELSPFEEDALKSNTRVGGGQEVTVRRSGNFKSGCRFKPKGEPDEVGWPADPASGADVVIKP